MFDPTAFENIKIVIDGRIYDLDLAGEIKIIDRNDILNTAKLSRQYDISFTDQRNENKECFCTFIMEAGLENLASELLPIANSEQLAGCQMKIRFTLKHVNELAAFKEIEAILKDIWGPDRVIKQTVKKNPFDDGKIVTNSTEVIFNRLVYEDQIEDMISMIDYMVKTLKVLGAYQL